jgi:hypothetical protein
MVSASAHEVRELRHVPLYPALPANRALDKGDGEHKRY